MMLPVAGATALPTAGMNGTAGQPYVPSGGVGGVGGAAGGVAFPSSTSAASAGCRVASDAQGASGVLLPWLAALVWQLRRTRRARAR